MAYVERQQTGVGFWGVMAKALMISVLLAILASLTVMPARAERSDVTIKGPGVELRQKRGWFGTGGTQYKDALGNNYSHSRGIFGGESASGGIFGARVSQSRSGLFNHNNTTVTGPDNQVMVQQKRGWFGKRTTVIDANSMLDNLRGAF
ncbi:MAG: hypothetical protein VKJ04_10560 [Vampirovibrionales bacterium]|nr:hypothetical protein [Vampirovibrionales bacterium]